MKNRRTVSLPPEIISHIISIQRELEKEKGEKVTFSDALNYLLRFSLESNDLKPETTLDAIYGNVT